MRISRESTRNLTVLRDYIAIPKEDEIIFAGQRHRHNKQLARNAVERLGDRGYHAGWLYGLRLRRGESQAKAKPAYVGVIGSPLHALDLSQHLGRVYGQAAPGKSPDSNYSWIGKESLMQPTFRQFWEGDDPGPAMIAARGGKLHVFPLIQAPGAEYEYRQGEGAALDLLVLVEPAASSSIWRATSRNDRLRVSAALHRRAQDSAVPHLAVPETDERLENIATTYKERAPNTTQFIIRGRISSTFGDRLGTMLYEDYIRDR